MLSKKELDILFRFYFKDHENQKDIFKPFDYQLEIADAIFNAKEKYIDVLATTRAGKSLIIALTSLLYGIENPGTRVRLVAPLFDQARILMDYVIEHLADHPVFISQLPLIRTDNAKFRIQQELTKNRIKFNNGSEFKILSAQGDGRRLQGWGGDLIIVDEAINIPDNVYQTYVARLMDNNKSRMVKIGNPTRKNHFYVGMKSKKHHSIVIDVRKCIADGRFTSEEVEDKAREMGGWDTPQVKAMLLCEWIDGGDNQLIHDNWIENALSSSFELDNPYFVIGVDVARFGSDSTVITTILRDDLGVIMENVVELNKQDNVEVAYGVQSEVKRIKEKYKADVEVIVVDDMGLGGGVVDILKNSGFDVIRFISGGKSDGDLYFNMKAESSWRLRKLFEDGKIKIKDLSKLRRDLMAMVYDYKSDKTIHIVDPNKSPDYYDSLMMACSYKKRIFSKYRIM